METRTIGPPGFLPERPTLFSLFSGIFRNRELIASLTRREVGVRYRGSMLGLAWPVLQPILMLGVYTFIFGAVFGARWPGVYRSDVLGYAVVVFTGLVTFNIFAESIRSSSKLIMSNRTFVQRVVFPLEILPVVQVGAALFNGLAGLAVLVVFMAFSGASFFVTAAWIPLVWFVFALFSLGMSYLLSALSVFLRDLEQIIGIAVTALFFGSAIFYPIERLPEAVQSVVRVVPTVAAVDVTRSLLLLGEVPEVNVLIAPTAVSLAMFLFGYVSFMMAKGRFADAL